MGYAMAPPPAHGSAGGIRPFGDVKLLGKPLFLETGGAVLNESGDQELCWSVLRFADERYEGATTRQARTPVAFGKYFFAEEGDHESFFAGQWKLGRPCGLGVRQYGNGSVFLGSVCSTSSGDTVPNGAGMCILSAGNVFAGDWKEGVIHGRGMQQASEGGVSMYIGHYSWGMRSGTGVYSFADGSEYSGQFGEDSPNGFGNYKAGKDCYMGQWAGGMRNGWSIFTSQEGSKTWAGQWQAGKLVWLVCLPKQDARVQVSHLDHANKNIQQCWKAARAACSIGDHAQQTADNFCSREGALQTELEMVRKQALDAGQKAEEAARKARALKPKKWGPRLGSTTKKLKRSHLLGLPAEGRQSLELED